MKIQNISSVRWCLFASTMVILSIWLMTVKTLYFPNSLDGLMKNIRHDFANMFPLSFSILLSPLILSIIFGMSFVKTRLDREGVWIFYVIPLVTVITFSIIGYFTAGAYGMQLFSIPFLIWPFIIGIKKKQGIKGGATLLSSRASK